MIGERYIRSPSFFEAQIASGIMASPIARLVLELHAEKTRLIEFGRFAVQNREQRGEGKPEILTFLGFTHYCGKRRKDGAFIVRRETAKKRLVAKLQAIKTELKHRRHEPTPSVGAWLRKVTSGYQYHAVHGNLPRLALFRWRLVGCGIACYRVAASAAGSPWTGLTGS